VEHALVLHRSAAHAVVAALAFGEAVVFLGFVLPDETPSSSVASWQQPSPSEHNSLLVLTNDLEADHVSLPPVPMTPLLVRTAQVRA
jgi:hypothetical protein